jgi:hypothetical protein
MEPNAHELMQIASITGGCALFGAMLGAVIAGYFSLRSKRNEFVNDYYRTVIQRRIDAYEELEKLIVAYKTSVVDKDCKPYHLPFALKSQNENAFMLMGSAMSQGLWLSEEAFALIRDMNYLLFQMPDSEDKLIVFGKEHYQKIAEYRESLEVTLASDLLSLHKVKRFLAQKTKRRSGFHPVQLYPRGKDAQS